MEPIKLPILPIPNLVFYPNTSIPVHIIEPVYVRMVRDCIDLNLYLGISMAEPVGQNPFGQEKYTPQKICGFGKPIILEEFPDGTIKILVRGEGRATLNKVLQNIPYLIYEADFLYDFPLNHTFPHEQILKVENILKDWTNINIQDSLEREAFNDSIHSIYHVIDYLCMFLIRDRIMRQLLLENQSLAERVQILLTILRGDHPSCEDSFAVQAIKDYEVIEKMAKVAH